MRGIGVTPGELEAVCLGPEPAAPAQMDATRGGLSRFSKGENVCPRGAEVTRRGRVGLRGTGGKRSPGLLPDRWTVWYNNSAGFSSS
jgi:hypothetical protein